MLHKKSLGQHFLRSKAALFNIAEAANLSRADTALEVGPGEGTLTELLLARAGKVVAVEKDDRLMP
ncbi:MAG TPA: 16S rRNA (adenine(1518)-N(6)/adenine(1519)-N(6))-dimethyltransferase, partial [Candidatus Taylorbacteria bacterium]|nr:16S rRNA (adenine(1518)-N(6)/adenine(1519)-N(6))-dimethyltransferase [Candidatus Taylorbacteria bacterium]